MTQRGKIRVGIVFGGQSAEHEISILSARNVLRALDRSRFEPILIGIEKTGRWLVQSEQKLLSGSSDPRKVRIDSDPPLQLASPFSGLSPETTEGVDRLDVIFPVL